MGMSGSGVRIGMVVILPEASQILLAQVRARFACFTAAAGTHTRSSAAQLTASSARLRIGTTPSVSAWPSSTHWASSEVRPHPARMLNSASGKYPLLPPSASRSFSQASRKLWWGNFFYRGCWLSIGNHSLWPFMNVRYSMGHAYLEKVILL